MTDSMVQVARVYCDLETSGLDPVYHSVVEVGAIAVDPGGLEVGEFQSLAFPGDWAMQNSDPNAFDISGIDPAEVRNARPIDQVALEFREWIRKYGRLHAYPLEFERGFLGRAPWSVPVMLWGDCIMEAAKSVMAAAGALPLRFGKPKRPKLSEAAVFFGVKAERFHRALDDARTTARIHLAILARRDETAAADEVRHLMEDGL